jgi:hypothetical protein
MSRFNSFYMVRICIVLSRIDHSSHVVPSQLVFPRISRSLEEAIAHHGLSGGSRFWTTSLRRLARIAIVALVPHREPCSIKPSKMPGVLETAGFATTNATLIQEEW